LTDYVNSNINKANESTELLENIHLNSCTNNITFIKKFKCLGVLIIPELNEDAKIQAQISKAKAQMDLLRHFHHANPGF